MRLRRALVHLRRNPSAGLLAVQILGVLLYPFMEHTSTGRVLFTLFGLLVLAAALRVVQQSPWTNWLGGLLALLIVLLSAVNAFYPAPAWDALVALFEAAFYFYAAGSLIAYMFRDDVASTDELFAAAATFTLLAWAFAYLYVLCQTLVPGSFGAALSPEQPRTWVELLFTSFTALSGVGLGDVVPLGAHARSLVMLEEFAGVMYIAIVVSRLVALHVAGLRAPPRD